MGILGATFSIPDQDGFIEDHGEFVIHEIAILCPCAGVDDFAFLNVVGTPLLNCAKCEGLGYFFRKPKRVCGLVTSVTQTSQFQNYSVRLQPGDCVFSPQICERKISHYDRITFTKEQPLDEGQIITRGAATLNNNSAYDYGLDPNEDRLWYEAASAIHVEAEGSTREYIEGADFELDGKVIRWFDGVMPIRTRYTIKYNGLIEWIAFDPPQERREQGGELGQRVGLRKIHYFRRSSEDASEESAEKRLDIGGVSTQ